MVSAMRMSIQHGSHIGMVYVYCTGYTLFKCTVYDALARCKDNSFTTQPAVYATVHKSLIKKPVYPQPYCLSTFLFQLSHSAYIYDNYVYLLK